MGQYDFLSIARFLFHMSLHGLLPFFYCKFVYKIHWKRPFLFMLGTMLIDLDHLFSGQVLDIGRCSLNTHPLHSTYAIMAYSLCTFIPFRKIRWLGMGALLHMAVDGIDCILMKFF